MNDIIYEDLFILGNVFFSYICLTTHFPISVNPSKLYPIIACHTSSMSFSWHKVGKLSVFANVVSYQDIRSRVKNNSWKISANSFLRVSKKLTEFCIWILNIALRDMLVYLIPIKKRFRFCYTVVPPNSRVS